jgi:hypothetical protein
MFFDLSFTFWSFIPFFPQGKVQPLNDWPTQFPNQCNGTDEREKGWKFVSMTGADDEFSKIPSSGTSKPMDRSLLGNPITPPQTWSSG